MRKFSYVIGLQDTPLCWASGWVPYGKSGWNGSAKGSNWEPCNNYAEYKDGGRLVCSKHAKKKNTALKVGIDYSDGVVSMTKIIIHRSAGVLPE